MTNSIETKFNLAGVTTIAARYGCDVRELERDKGESEIWEITLPFEDSDLGQVDMPYVDSVWTCDPYFHGDASFTPDQMRSVAASLVIAATMVTELNHLEA